MNDTVTISSKSNWQLEKNIKQAPIKLHLRALLSQLIEFRSPSSPFTTFPLMKTLAERLGKSVSTARRYVRELETLGYLHVFDCHNRADGGQGANVYLILKTAEGDKDPSMLAAIGGRKPRRSRGMRQGIDRKDCAAPLLYMRTPDGKRRMLPPDPSKLLTDGVSVDTPPSKNEPDNSSYPGTNHKTKNTTKTEWGDSTAISMDALVADEILFRDEETPFEYASMDALPLESQITCDNTLAATEALAVFAEEFPDLVVSKKTERAFRERHIIEGRSDKVLDRIRRLGRDPILRFGTFSPNRVWDFETALKIRRSIVGEVRRIQGLNSFDRCTLRGAMVHSSTLRRHLLDDDEAICKFATMIMQGEIGYFEKRGKSA